MKHTASWQDIASQKRQLRDAALQPYLVDDLDQRLPRVENVEERTRLPLDPRSQMITDIDSVTDLLQCLGNGEFTAEEVTTAYIRRATIAHQLTNSITEVLFDDALKHAKELDSEFNLTGKLRGPLHGIPFTLKDQFNVQGVDTTLGYVGRSFHPATEDAVLVSILKQVGAVIIAKTNLPQSIMWAETDNPLWGLTVNPRNPELTPCGSTGGEAVLLALHGSIFGWGTDLGGSVRMPAYTMGHYGFKPTSSRLPYEGVPVSTEGQEHVPSSIGPLARDLSSICYLSRMIADTEPWKLDPKCSPIPWREMAFREIQSRPMVIGLILDDGVVKVHPPIQRALAEVSAKLKAAGHELVVWDTSDHWECIKIMDLYYTADGCEDIRRDVAVAGEPLIPHVEALVNRGKAISVYDYWQLNRRRNAAQKKYLDKWNTTRSACGRPVDVLLAPTMPHTAVPHRHVRWVGYTKIWNFFDYPAITLPIDKVRADKDTLPTEPYQPRNELDAWNWSLYDVDVMKGHPVSLQIIGRKLEEEKVLGAATAIQKIWQGEA